MYFFGAKAFLISAIITVKIVYLGFLASYTSGVAPIMRISRALGKLGLSLVSYSFLLNFKFRVRYKVGVKFGCGFFKYPFYSRILVLLVLLYTKLKHLLSVGRYSS